MARRRSRKGACSRQKAMKYRPTTDTAPWKAYGVERRAISLRFGLESSAVAPSRSSTWLRCEKSSCGSSRSLSGLVRPKTCSCSSTLIWFQPSRSWTQRWARMKLPPAPGDPSGTRATSGSRSGSGLPVPSMNPVMSSESPRMKVFVSRGTTMWPARAVRASYCVCHTLSLSGLFSQNSNSS